jgi:hypothetical protein
MTISRILGNTPSPILYNMAQQIFLFKLELCPEIKSVFLNHLVPRPIQFNDANPWPQPVRLAVENNQDPDHIPNQEILPVEFRNESGRETDKAEGFADDTTGMSLFELESLACLKKNLVRFWQD